MSQTRSRQTAPRRAPAPKQRRTGGQPSRGARPGGSSPGSRWTLGVVAAVVAAGALILLGWALAGAGQDPIEERAAELRQQEAVRDREQIADLTAQARETRDAIVPVLNEFDVAVPLDGEATTGEPASPEAVEHWHETVAEAAADYEDAPSGTTGTNLARNSLALAVGLVEGAVDLYDIALQAEDEDLRAQLLERAAEQRNLAVRTWSVGATQLDAINIDAGFGHQHVYLDTEAAGALTPDGAPEGSDAHADH